MIIAAHGGAVMLPVALLAFSGYRCGWSLSKILTASAIVGCFMYVLVFWGTQV